jgi:GT2 family glycosyltransferase
MDETGVPGLRPLGRVTVVVATRDRREQLLASVGRLVALPERPHVVVVDNGSGDGTPEAVRTAYGQVTVIEARRNLGAVARTVGVRAARTPYVAFSDDDSWWEPGALARAAAVLDTHPGVGLLAARILVGEEGRLDPVCQLLRDSPLPRPPGLPGPAVLGFVACGAVVRRSAYLGVGGFSPVVFFLGEETVLAEDLASAGWDLVYCEDVVARHHPGSAPPRHPGRRRRLQARNAILSAWLRRPAGSALRETSAVVSRTGPDGWRALGSALLRSPGVARDRRVVPPWLEEHLRLLGR